MSTAFDPRLTPARPDLAAAHLRGQVTAERYVEGVTYQVSAGVAPIRRAPAGDAMQETQTLLGEVFTVYEERDGFGWGQSGHDGYVGWVDMAALSAPVVSPTHRVNALRTYVFSEANLKSAPLFLASLNSKVTVTGTEGKFSRCDRTGWIYTAHLDAVDAPAEVDFVTVAERFLHAPYFWGGKESLGCDCSGLIQSALERCGLIALRDTDMMERTLGEPIAIPATLEGLHRGDLVFWKGHVGVMRDSQTLLHANAYHMAVASEPLAEAVARITPSAGPITSIRRLAGGVRP
jgi:cell wall-associated NlpC family hydrolase